MLRSTIIDAIGQTPLVKLRLDENAIGPVYAKLEMMNLFGMKDRVAKRLFWRQNGTEFCLTGLRLLKAPPEQWPWVSLS